MGQPLISTRLAHLFVIVAFAFNEAALCQWDHSGSDSSVDAGEIEAAKSLD